MSEINELAGQLGKAISQSPQAAALRAASAELRAQTELVKLMEDFHRQMAKIADLERQRKPVEVEYKHKLRALNDRLVASEPFKKLSAAQVDYVELKRKALEAVRAELAETEQA